MNEATREKFRRMHKYVPPVMWMTAIRTVRDDENQHPVFQFKVNGIWYDAQRRGRGS